MLTRAVPVIIDAQLMEWYCFALELGSAPPTDAATGRPTVEEQRQVQALRRELAAALASARTSKEAVHIAIDRGPRLLGADGALVLLDRGVNGLRVVGQQGVPPEAGARWKVVPAGADSPALESMRAGRWVRRSVTAANGAGAVITDSFPLGDDDQVFGAMTFVWPSEESSRPAAAAHTAAVTGEVLSRILQSEKDQAVAEDLQRLMLPRSLPRIDGAELAAVSIPGSSDAQVGGDWFEAVSLPDGQVLLVVGDVMGRGLRAAKTMTELRFALRAFTVVTSEPHAVLANLAKHLELFGREDDLITVLAVLVEPRTGSIRWSSAGHIPPILIHHGGNGEYLLDGQGSPLGVGDEWPQAKARLEDGDQVVLVSDGLVETRTRSLDEGMDRLLRAVAGSGARSAAVFLDEIVGGAHGRTAGTDDVTALCLRIDSDISAHGWRLPAEPATVARARALVWDELDRLGVTDLQDREAIRLLTSEIVTNAVRHSQSDITLCLDRVDRVVRLSVSDDHPEIDISPRPIEVEADHGRGLQLVDGLSNSWGVTVRGGEKLVWFEFEVGVSQGALR
jgi:anti-sigma regulatory factor (Ser/Thr protein kinase)